MPSLEYFFYLKNIHLCMSVFQFLLLKNTFVWVDSNGIAFTWISFLPEEYTPLYRATKTVFSTPEKKLSKLYTPLCELTKMTFSTLKMFYTWRIYTSVQAHFNFFNVEYIYLCESWLIWCFLRLKMLSARRIYIYVLTF